MCEIYDAVVFDGVHQEDKIDLKAWGDLITPGGENFEKGLFAFHKIVNMIIQK